MNENFDGHIIKWFSLLEVPMRVRPAHNSGYGSHVKRMCANAVLFKWHNRKTDYADGRELISPKSKEEENELEGEHSSAATAARGESVFIPALGLRETPRSNAVHHSRRRLVNSIKL